MSSMIKKILIISLIISALAVPVFAQRTGNLSGSTSSPTKYSLTVNANVAGATVQIEPLINKTGTVRGNAPFTAQLEKGSYRITVQHPGYISQSRDVNLQSSQTVSFSLAADKPGLTVTSNVVNASVEISSINQSFGTMRGNAPFTAPLDKGRYTVTVSAVCYVSQSKQINLSSSATLNFNLEVENYSLSVTSNVVNARVQIKGSAINGTLNGNTTYNTVLPPGSYNVKVNAPGYFALTKTVQLNGTQSIDFQLQPKTAKLNVVILNEILNYTVSNPAGQVMIYDNGKLVTGTNIQLNPGQHTIRIVSGAFAAQQTINVRAGETYSFELDFGFSVIKN